MRQSFKDNRERRGGGMLGRFAAEKKKTGIALCLIAIMAVMWIKVLTKKGPADAQAGTGAEQGPVREQPKEEPRISFIDLPQVPGRNDLISRDFFATAGWEDFAADEDVTDIFDVGVDVPATDTRKNIAERIEQLLRLQAIGWGQNPQAFINDKLLSVGEKLVVTDGKETYECEVIEIRRNAVLIRCREAEITLKLDQMIDENS